MPDTCAGATEDSLDRSIAMAEQSRNMGVGIMEELSDQGDKLDRIAGYVCVQGECVLRCGIRVALFN